MDASALAICEATRLWFDMNEAPVHECLKKMFAKLVSAYPADKRSEKIVPLIDKTIELMKKNGPKKSPE
jgi:hypothetical protein